MSRVPIKKPVAKGSGEKRLQRWPAAKAVQVETVKWRVWLGYQLRAWRLDADAGREMMQKKASARSGLSQDVISRIERGERRVDPAELVALAYAYHRTPKELGQLFTPPTQDQWRWVQNKRRSDDRFAAPPVDRPFPSGARRKTKTPVEKRNRRGKNRET